LTRRGHNTARTRSLVPANQANSGGGGSGYLCGKFGKPPACGETVRFINDKPHAWCGSCGWTISHSTKSHDNWNANKITFVLHDQPGKNGAQLKSKSKSKKSESDVNTKTSGLSLAALGEHFTSLWLYPCTSSTRSRIGVPACLHAQASFSLPSLSIAIPSSAEMSSLLHQSFWYTHLPLPLGLSFYSSFGRYRCHLLVTTTLPSGQHPSWLPSCKSLRRCLQAPSSQVMLSHPPILNGLWSVTVQARIFLDEAWLSSSLSSWEGHCLAGEVWHNNARPSH